MTLSGADRSDRSHRPVRPVCPRQPAKNITSNNLHHTITYRLDRMIKSITLISTHYKCPQVHELDKVRDYYKFQSSKAQTGQTGLLEQKAKTLNFLSSSPSSRFSPCSSPSLFFLSFNLVLLPLCHPSP